MRHALHVAWRAVAAPWILGTLGVVLFGSLMSPIEVAVLDSGAMLPTGALAAWLGARLAVVDDTNRQAAHLRLLPIAPGTLFLARAALGAALLLASLVLLVPLWLLGPSEALRDVLVRSIPPVWRPPASLALLGGWLLAAYGASAYLAAAASSPSNARSAWVGGLLAAIALASIPALWGGPLHALLGPALAAAGLAGIGAAWAACRRRELAAGHDRQVLEASKSTVDRLLAAPAELLFWGVPLAMLVDVTVGAAASALGGHRLAWNAATWLAGGLALAPWGLAQVRAHDLALLPRLGAGALVLSGAGWPLWRALRRDGPRACCAGCGKPRLVASRACRRCGVEELTAKLRSAPRRARVETVAAAWAVAALAWVTGLGTLRFVHAWEVELQDQEAELWRNGELAGVGGARGLRLGERGGPLLPWSFRGGLNHAALEGGHIAVGELVAALEQDAGSNLDVRFAPEDALPLALDLHETLSVRLAGREVDRLDVWAQAHARPGHTETELRVRVEAAWLEEEAQALLEAARTSTLGRPDLERWAELGDPLALEVRRRTLARLAPPKDPFARSGMRPLSRELLAIRERQLEAFDALCAVRYGADADPERAFREAWRDLETRASRLEPLGATHGAFGLWTHVRHLAPQLRLLATLDGDGRGLLDAELRAGDPYAAVAVGMRGDPADFDTLARRFRARLAGRATRDGGAFELEMDQVVLAFGWAMFATDRARAVEALLALLGRPDPTAPELLVLNGGAPIAAELERWIGKTDRQLARTWRLRDARQAQELRRVLRRARLGVDSPFEPADYFEQSPGFLTLEAPEVP